MLFQTRRVHYVADSTYEAITFNVDVYEALRSFFRLRLVLADGSEILKFILLESKAKMQKCFAIALHAIHFAFCSVFHAELNFKRTCCERDINS